MSDKQQFISQPVKQGWVKNRHIIAWTLSVVVLGIVVSLRYLDLPLPEDLDLTFCPTLHAILNTLSFFSLLAAWFFVMRGQIKLHRFFIQCAMILSTIFVLSYVLYHATHAPVTYQGEGVMRTIYFSLLLTHIILAAVMLPFILLTWMQGMGFNWAAHKKLARWVMPLWLVVCATGPICYLMLY